MKICKRGHRSEAFGDVPLGSLWDDESAVVAETPDAFRAVRAVRGTTLEVDDDDEVA